MKLFAILGLCLMVSTVAFAGEGDDRYCDPCIDIEEQIYPEDTWQTVSGSTVGEPNAEYVYCFCAGAGGAYTFSFCQQGGYATFDTALSIQGPDVCGAVIECNDDFCGLQSELTFYAPMDATYLIVVDGFGSGAGNYTLAYMGPGGASPAGDTSWGGIKTMYR